MMRKEHIAYLSLGSNVGDRERYLCDAVRLLEDHPRIRVISLSHFYETEPLTLNGERQNWYLNCALKLKTTLNAIQLFRVLEDIETLLGRVRFQKWGPRTIDLDLLFFDDEIIRTQHLTVPHAQLHQRRFVLEPLAEIAPNWIHPVKGVSIRALLKELKDNKKIHPLYKFQMSHLPDGIFKTPAKELL